METYKTNLMGIAACQFMKLLVAAVSPRPLLHKPALFNGKVHDMRKVARILVPVAVTREQYHRAGTRGGATYLANAGEGVIHHGVERLIDVDFLPKARRESGVKTCRLQCAEMLGCNLVFTKRLIERSHRAQFASVASGYHLS